MSWTPPPPPTGGPHPPPPPGYGHPGPPPPPAARPPQDRRPAPPTPPGPPPPASWPTTPPPGPPGLADGHGTGLGYDGPAPAEHGNLGLALVGGFAGAFVVGLVWWGIVATTRLQFTMVAIVIGWIVAQAVLACCQRRNRLPLQAIAAVSTLLSLAVSEYFIQRTLFIREYGDRFDGLSVPLWDGFGYARDVVEESLRDDPLTGLFWLAAVVTAVVVAGTRESIADPG